MKSPISQFIKLWTAVIFVVLVAQAVPAKSTKVETATQDCEIYPIALSLNSVSNIETGTVLSNLRNGTARGQFGWLTWSGNRSRQALIESLTPPGNSSTYINPNFPRDPVLSERNWVKGTETEKNRKMRDTLDRLKKRELIVPVWYQAWGKEGKGAYRIASFAKIELLSYDLNLQDKITVRYLGEVRCDRGNQAPVVYAGEDQTINYPARAILNGSVIDDGLPANGKLTAEWSKVSVPGTVIFADPNSAVTLASFSDPGTYVLRLTGSDKNRSTTDDVVIEVTESAEAPVAHPQTVNTSEDVAVNITLTGFDPDSDNLTFHMLSNPSFGVLSGIAPNLVYTPAANVSGTDSFTFKVNDGLLDSAPATVTIHVAAVNDAPVAYAQSVTTDEDSPIAVVLTGNDVEGIALVFTIVTSPSHGVLSGTPPNLVYTPAANYFSSDEFTFKVDDGAMESAPAVVTLTVRGVNDAPVAAADQVSLNEDSAADIVLRGTDIEGSALTFAIVNHPAHGALSGTPPNVRYVPAANYHGADSFTFKVNDGSLDSAPAVVSLTVGPVNDAPVALGDTVVLDEDTAADLVLRGNDVESSPLTFTVLSAPTHGVLSGTAPTLRYVPGANYHGSDSFTFKVNDGSLDSAPATVNLTVRSVNDAPVAVSDTVSLDEDTAADIVLRGADIEGNTLTFTVMNLPSHGVLSGTPPTVRYVPAANYYGPDSFSFKVNDGELDSTVALVSLTVLSVNDGPVALADEISLDEDTGADLVLRGSDVEGDSLTFSVVNGPAHGVLNGTPPTLRYVPAANYHGPESFTFKVSDGELDSAPATVTLTVRPVNDAPVALGDQVSLDEDTGADVVLRGTDVEGGSLTFTIMSAPTHGVLSGTPPAVRYVPAANYHGPDSFTFKVNDGELDSAPATVSVTVASVNDAPVAVSQNVSVAEDSALNITLTGSDVDGDSLSYAVVVQPAHGRLSGSGANLTYTPAANYNGSDSFQFRANDGAADSDLATVSITITPVNDVPVAVAQSIATLEDTSLSISLTGTDVENSPLTFTLTSTPSHGQLAGTPPDLVYTPNENFNGSDSFAFTVNDGEADSAAAVVSISVTPVNDPPVALSQSVQAVEKESTAINLVASDVDNDPLTFEVVSGPTNGTLSGVAPNLNYTPIIASRPETDEFTFTVSDGTVTSATATVSIDIIYNQPPVVSAGPGRAIRSTAEVITLAGLVTDDGLPRNSTLEITWVLKHGPGTATFGDASAAITTASFSADGLYILELSATDSEYTSRDFVEVRVNLICSANPPGAIAWWTANGLSTDILSGNEGVLENGTDYGAGKIGAAFTFDGMDDQIVVAPSASLDLGAGNSFTIEFWVNSADVIRSVRLLGWHSGIDIFAPDLGVNIFQSGGQIHAQIYDTNNLSHEMVAFNVLTNNVWTHIAVTYDRISGQGRIYANGALRTTAQLGNFRPRTTFPLYFGHLLSDANFFQGALDEITLFTRALDSQEIYEIFAANGTGKCPPTANQPPLVNAGPDIYLRDVSGIAALNGAATDDGLPAPASLRAAWSVVSAPGSVTFANGAALSTTATFDAPGLYVLRLSVDDAEIVRSDIVEVRVATLCTIEDPVGLVGWWPANGTFGDVIANREGRLAGGTSFAAGRVGGAFSFDGVNDSVRTPGDSTLDVGTGNGFSIEFWMNSADVLRNARVVAYHSGLAANGTNLGVNIFQFSGNVHVQIPDLAGLPHEFVATGTLTNNTWTHVAVTYDRARGHGRIYINGGQRTLSNVGSYVARTAYNLHFGNIPFDANHYRGLLDEVSIYNRTLDAQEVFDLFAAGASGKCPNDANLGPLVNAGSDVFLRDVAETAVLNGSISDDGLPPGYGIQSLWSVVDGPGTVTFADATVPVTTATFSAPGLYVLRLTADDGIVSVSDLVEARVASLCTVKEPAGLAAWWPGNSSASEVVAGRHGRLAGGTTFGSGRVSSAFRFDGINDAVQVPAHPSLDIGLGNGLTVEFWVNPTDLSKFARIVGYHFGIGTLGTNFGVNVSQQSGGALSAQIYDTAGVPHDINAPNSLVSNLWTHVAVTYDRTTGQGRIFINGALRTTASLGTYTPRTSYNLYFGNLPSDANFFRGMLDEVNLYNRPLDVQEIYDIFAAGAIGKCPRGNQAPVVDAGLNVELASAVDVATLNGLVTDDALPAGAGLRVAWSKLDGPGTVSFGDANAATTTAQFSAPGIYVLQLSADDAAIMQSDLVEVRVAVPCSTAPAGLVAWWPGNGSAQEVVGALDGRLGGGTSFASGRVSAAFSFDGTNDTVQIPAHANLDVGLGGGLTIEFWVNPADVTRNARMVAFHSGLAATATNIGVNVQMLGRTLSAQLYDTAGIAHDISAANALTNNTWTHVAVTYDRAAGQGRIYLNGVPRPPVTVGSYTARTSYRLFFGNMPFDPNHFRGLLDEVSIYDHALTSNEVAAVFAAGAAGKCPPSGGAAPMFVQELASAEPMATVTENEHGQRTAMTDASGNTGYTYDKQGRLTRVDKSWSAHAGAPALQTSLSYEYDAAGRLVGIHSLNVNGASMHYVWNDANHLVEVFDPHSGSTTYHYDAAGNAVGYTYPDGVTGSGFGVLTSACYEQPGETVVCDADGNRVRRTVSVGSRTVTTYYVVSLLSLTGTAQVVEELTFDSAEPLLATPSVTRVYVHGLHSISVEELVNGQWELSFFE